MGSRLRCRVRITEFLSHLVKLLEWVHQDTAQWLTSFVSSALQNRVLRGDCWRLIIVSKWLPNPLKNNLNLFYPPFLNLPTYKLTVIGRISHPAPNRIWGGGKGQQKSIWRYRLSRERKVETMFSVRSSCGVPIKAPGPAGVSWRGTCAWTCSGAIAVRPCVRSEATGDTPGIVRCVKVKNLNKDWWSLAR